MASPPQPRDRRDFQIAIICALPLEADAVEALFDNCWSEDGEIYGKAPGDPNAYTTGVIGLHNIVLAQLSGMGKSRAVNFVSGIRSSFAGIRLAIIVGICGGVPNGANGDEVLLGDVVISNSLVQYDFGRQWPNCFVRKDTLHDNLSKPNAEIQAHIAKLTRIKVLKRLEDNTVRYLTNLRQELGEEMTRYPGVHTDKLFEPNYRHKHHDSTDCAICVKCEKAEDEVCETALQSSCAELKCNEKYLVARKRLAVTSPMGMPKVHFGIIASGDTVMKSGKHRDEIAARENVLAFEMEGAGVWDIYPCIVIKGVCDYADSHKNKDWQNYAAAAAASCTKAFLKEWVPMDNELPPLPLPMETGLNRLGEPTSQSIDSEKSMQDCLLSLSFSSIDDRQNNIQLAHRETCDWLFETLEFQRWCRRTDLLCHNGILWIKGKPGAGKSTLMKHTLRYCLAQESFKGYNIAAYFFNARGNSLEQTPIGMLRSLLYQLLDQDRIMCKRFIPKFLDKYKKHGNEWEWHEGDLKDFLISEIGRPQRKPILLLVDALDECNEPEVRAVVSFLESLSINAIKANTVLNVCLSSRHYPHISMKIMLELTVEGSIGHDQDIAKYVRGHLKARDEEIMGELMKNAKHVFMWVVLVVEILNKAFDDGEVRAMKDKLREIPSDLDEVFFTILKKHNSRKQETILMLQWVLFAKVLLKPEELYFAVLAGSRKEELGQWDQTIITPHTIRRFITSTSKGLIEVREGKINTVQFIHETVTDFLLRNKRLQRLDPMLEQYPVGIGHCQLAACCMSYIMMKEMEMLKSMPYAKSKRLLVKYPFLRYSIDHILHHADRALAGGVNQKAFLNQFSTELERFKRIHDTFNEVIRRGIKDADLVHIVSLYGYCEILRAILKEGADVNAQGGKYGNALQAASSSGHNALVKLLLGNGADVNSKGGQYGNALQAASSSGHNALVKLLLDNGADVNLKGGQYGTALQAASYFRANEVVELLLDNGADVNLQGGLYGTALQAASRSGHNAVVKLLLDNGADVNLQGGELGTALQAASFFGSYAVVKLLLDNGADVNLQGGLYGTALQAASRSGLNALVKLLLDKGADVNLQGGRYGNAIQAAAISGEKKIVALLVDHGADFNPKMAVMRPH